MLRAPAVAGRFYPGHPQELRAMIEGFLEPAAQPAGALAAVCPHAGYIFSGAVAGKVLSRVQIPRRVLVMGPNHQGLGQRAALMSRGAWQTPLGAVQLDAKLGTEILSRSALAAEDSLAHQYEHSLEVQVPILQCLREDFLLTPLCLSLLSFAECEQLGRDIAGAIQALGEPVLMVASTDMTHYESAQQAQAKDSKALEAILALDPQGLYRTVTGLRISMCGVLPTTVALAAALELGATAAELVAYTNSGAVTGDTREVVAYAGLIIK
ncbi:MAG: AmmeMemoRadiSam system protein B [Desulfarculus sp.]|jgi:AmmeMemoRadiSam system protein B|nr:MAG: AmmeMemoRadiSam system protein B [Desulfarculus sp.]